MFEILVIIIFILIILILIYEIFIKDYIKKIQEKQSNKRLLKTINDSQGQEGSLFIENKRTGAIVLLNTKTGKLTLLRTALPETQIDVGIKYIEDSTTIKDIYIEKRKNTKNNSDDIILSDNWYEYNKKNPEIIPTQLANPKEYPNPPYN